MRDKLIKLSKEDLEDVLCEILEVSDDSRFRDFIDDKIYHFTKEHAMHIVRNMKPHGQVFSLEQCKNIVTESLKEYEYLQYYLCINMYANDAMSVAEAAGMPLDKFCYHMAKSFINDIDAGPHKVEKYFTEVASV